MPSNASRSSRPKVRDEARKTKADKILWWAMAKLDVLAGDGHKRECDLVYWWATGHVRFIRGHYDTLIDAYQVACYRCEVI